MGIASKKISLYYITVLCKGMGLKVTSVKFLIVFMRRMDSECF
jgi:hypothetical protein